MAECGYELCMYDSDSIYRPENPRQYQNKVYVNNNVLLLDNCEVELAM